MNKKELQKNLTTIIKALENISELLGEDVSNEVVEQDNSEGKAVLEDMKYQELKKLATQKGVNAKGTREELIKRLSELEDEHEDDEDDDDEDVQERKSTKTTKKSKKEEVVEEEEDDDEDDKDDKQEETYAEIAEQMLGEYETSEIIEVLKDAGVKGVTKKNVKEKLIYALENDLIDLEDEDEEDDDNQEEKKDEKKEKSSAKNTKVAEKEELDIDSDDYFEEFDEEGYNDPSDMTKKRHKAVQKHQQELIELINSGEVSEEDIDQYLEDFTTDEEKENIPEDFEEKVKFYLELNKRFVDDDGNVNEPNEPYELGGENFCNGHLLSYNKKKNIYTCVISGEQFGE